MTTEFTIVGGGLALLLFGLFVEKVTLASIRRSIPLCICVTGTRGKSSVVRLVAAGLRGAGRRVVAKTTGSRAIIIAPDGSEHPVRRWAPAWILEQRRLLSVARRWQAQVLVSEVMSIRPENYRTEVDRIMRPEILVVTNVRLDHTKEQGDSLDDIGAQFGRGAPRNGTVFVPATECSRGLREALTRRSSRVVTVSEGLPDATIERFSYEEWSENVGLALAVCEALGARKEEAIEGMLQAQPDFGSLKRWHLEAKTLDRSWIAVNGFAANDPESTLIALRRVTCRGARERVRTIGLLNLRWDRGDRTEQWCRSLMGDFPPFDRLFLLGGHAHAAHRRLRRRYGERVLVVKERSSAEIMARIEAIESAGGVLFGFGNIGGRGSALVDYWNRVGQAL